MNTEKMRIPIIDYFDLLLIGSAHALSDGFLNLLVPVLALIVADFKLTDIQTGILLSSFSLSAFIFVFPASLAADRSGKKLEMLLAGLGLASSAYIIMLSANSFSILVILAFLAGAGNSVYHPCGTSITAQRFAHIRPHAISVHGMMGNIGTSVIPIVLAYVAQAATWRWAVALCTLPVIVILPALWLRFNSGMHESLKHSKEHKNQAGSLSIAVKVFRDKRIRLLAVIYSLSGIGTKASIGFIPLLVTRKYDFSTAFIGLLMSLYYFMGIISKPLMGYIYSKLGPKHALYIPLLISFTVTLAIGIVPWPAVMVLLVALAGMANPISPVILTAASDFSDSSVLASSVGLIYSFHAAGFIGPLIGGFIAERAGISFTYVFASLFFLSGALMTFSIEKKY